MSVIAAKGGDAFVVKFVLEGDSLQNVAMRIVLKVACVLLIVGAVLTGYMLLNLDSRNIIDVELDEYGSAILDFSSEGIKPGDTIEYVMAVESDLPGTCMLTLDFEETERGILKNYLYIKVTVEGEVIADCLLADLVDGEEPLSVPCKVRKTDDLEIKVEYFLPLETGNEVKNASVNYLLHITLSNE